MGTTSQTKKKQQTKVGEYTHRLSDVAAKGRHESFREDEGFYRNVVESLEDYAVFTTDTHGNVSSWNKGAERLLGYSEDEIIDENIDILFVPEDRAIKAPQDELNKAARDRKALDERWHLKKDGTRFWASGLVFPLEDEQGKLRGFTKVMRDLTDKKLAAQEVIRSEERFQTLIEKSSDIVALSDTEGNYSYVSPGIRKVLGYMPDEFTKINGFQLMHPDELEYIGQQFKELLANPGSSTTIELRGRHKDGSWRWLEATATNLLDDPKIGAIVSNFRDITDRKEAETERTAAIEEAAQFFNMPDLLLAIASTDGYFRRLNPAWEKMLGHSTKELTSRPWTDFVHPDDVQPTMAEGKKLEAGVSTLHFQNRYRCKDGSYKWILWNVRPEGDVLYAAAQDITPLKQYEEQLRESEEQFRLIVQGVKDYAIFRLDPKGNVSSWNAGAEHIKGYKADEVIGQHISTFYTPEDKANKRPLKLLARARKEGKAEDEGWRVKKDGSKFWAHVTITAIKNDSGKLIGYSKITRDITERKNYEETLRKNEERFALAQQAANIGTFEWNVKSGGFVCTAQLESLYGLPKGGLSGRLENWLQMLHPEDSQQVADELQAALSGRPLDTEFRIIRPNGDVRWVAIRAKLFYDEEGNPERLLGINRNVTKRRLAEDKLKESEERFRQLADSMPQIVWTANTNGTADYYNKQWYNFTGFSQNANQGWIKLLHPDDIDYINATWRESVSTGKTFQAEYRFKDRQTGKYRWFLSRALPVKDNKGKIIKWFGTSTDIDDIKTTTIRKTELEQLTATLKQQREELVLLNSTKDEFISLASHQLRTPATGVKQYVGMLLEGYVGTLQEEQEAMLRYAYESNERQLKIIDDLLNVAHVDAGKVKVEKKPCNLLPLVHNVLQEQLSKFKSRDQKLVFNKPDDPIQAPVDARLIRMVVENLVDNAGKYTPEGRQIRVKVSEKARPKCAVITIQDQGVGIDKEDFSKLFQKFSRVSNPLSETVGGTGLGLYWVKRVIDLHDGNIKVTSTVGKGTTFTIELPAAA